MRLSEGHPFGQRTCFKAMSYCQISFDIFIGRKQFHGPQLWALLQARVAIMGPYKGHEVNYQAAAFGASNKGVRLKSGA